MDVSQRDEIPQLEAWLVSHGHMASAGHGHHDGHRAELMPGMLADAELTRLESTEGPRFVRLFLQSIDAQVRPFGSAAALGPDRERAPRPESGLKGSAQVSDNRRKESQRTRAQRLRPTVGRPDESRSPTAPVRTNSPAGDA
jgi:Domain of unknown function (DUF305)